MPIAADLLEARYLLAAGDLDPTFGDGGEVITTFEYENADVAGLASQDVAGLAVQSDGKILVAGSAYDGSGYDFTVVRYNADGSLDSSFGVDGKVVTDFDGGRDLASGIVLQRDGKIVVAGYTYNGISHDFALARYNTDGSLDNDFDGDGKLTTDFGDSTSDEAAAVCLQADGKIVVAGSTLLNEVEGIALVRYGDDGSLDPSFGNGGKVNTEFGSNARATSIALQSDGRIVVAGYASLNNGDTAASHIALFRYGADGSLDSHSARLGSRRHPLKASTT